MSPEATPATRAANARVLEELPFADTQDFEDAHRGFIAPLPHGGVIENADGRPVWDLSGFAFAADERAPETVNPSLWRQLRLTAIAGLFEVVPRLYQVRGNDLSSITFVEGDTGVVVVDTCLSAETARAGLDLYREHRGDRAVVAVIYTHSHVDHFGGVRGIVDEADVEAGRVRVIGPEHLVAEAVSENVFAGNHMGRRASYMYGNLLAKGPEGNAGAGLGLETSSGNLTLIAPTEDVTETGQSLVIDGLTFEFLLAPESEAPAEMHFYVRELRALTAAENATHLQHNIYTLRGAKPRDARRWSGYLQETLERWGDVAEVLYAPHHWPIWGGERIREHLRKQRDLYKYLNDQTLRLANHGFNMIEAAEQVELPPELARYWANRGYYGSVNHNTKGVWAYYLGWFDGNPARLHPLPPAEAGRRLVEYMGGADAVLERARKDFESGEYRWVAQVLDHVVSADPGNQEARELLADTLTQLGYQAESGPWRNFYLTGALELREGVRKMAAPSSASPDLLRALTIEQILDFVAIRLNGPKAAGRRIAINLSFTDTERGYGLVLENAVLNHMPPVTEPDVTLTLTRAVLDDALMDAAGLAGLAGSEQVTVEGDAAKLAELAGLLDTFDFWWDVVTPNPAPAG